MELTTTNSAPPHPPAYISLDTRASSFDDVTTWFSLEPTREVKKGDEWDGISRTSTRFTTRRFLVFCSEIYSDLARIPLFGPVRGGQSRSTEESQPNRFAHLLLRIVFWAAACNRRSGYVRYVQIVFGQYFRLGKTMREPDEALRDQRFCAVSSTSCTADTSFGFTLVCAACDTIRSRVLMWCEVDFPLANCTKCWGDNHLGVSRV